MNADVKAIREKFSDITEEGKLIIIDIGSTHIPKSGRDDKYIVAAIEKTADAIRTVYNKRIQGQLYYSSESRPENFLDGRDPHVIDGKFHLLRFVPDDSAKKEIYITNFGAHGIKPWLGQHKDIR